MTIDERLEFLLQSTESLHASTQELHATALRHDSQIAALLARVDKHEREWDRFRHAMRAALQAWLNENEKE